MPLSSGCTLLNLGDHSQRTLVVQQEPRVVAWALAATCRELMPGCYPAQGHPLILQAAEGSYRLHFSRPETGPFRVAANGTISPARLVLTGDALNYIPGEFQAIPQEVSCGRSENRLRIRIDAHRQGSLVEITWRGSAGILQAVDDRIADALRLLEACTISMELAAAEDWPRLQEYLGRVDANLCAGPASQSCTLAAPLHWYRSLTHQALGFTLTARTELSHCLDLDPSLGSIRARLLQMDSRLSKSPEALRNLHTMLNDGRLGLASHLLAGPFNRLRAEFDSADESNRSMQVAKVARALDRGDLPSARSWLDRCIAEASGPCSEQLWRLQVRLLRAAGEYRSAFTAGLALRMTGNDDPIAILDCCQDSLQLGEPSLGLRLLARNWADLHRREPKASERTLRDLLKAMDPLLATRILVIERTQGLTDPSFLALLEDSGLGANSKLLLSLVGKRRPLGEPRLLSPNEFGRQPGFENAPGVAPAR